MKTLIVDGHLVKDAEIREYTKDGNTYKFLSFVLANNEYENNQTVTTYYNVTSYDLNEISKQERTKCFMKGRKVTVEGKPKEEHGVQGSKVYINRYINTWKIHLGATPSKENYENNARQNVVPNLPTCEIPSVNPTVSVQVPTPQVNKQTMVVPKMEATIPQFKNDTVNEDNGELPF